MPAQWPGAKSDFKFKPVDLDRPSFRLLRLKPARALATPIECELVHAFLDEDVFEYEAISYTWGSVVSLRNILLDGSTFFVPFNLWSALRDVRLRDQERVLWVDAVCINQSDARERGHQVQRMGQIYHQAERVIIWLGPLTNPSIGSLMDLLAVLQRETRGVNWCLSDPRWQSHWEQITKGSSDELRSAFFEILERPWFRRVWVLQEVANAHRALVHCGPKAISAKVFVLCAVLLHVQLDSHCQAILDVMPGPSRRESWWIQDRRLLTLLKKFSNTEATVDHDRIFALLGLCPEANARIPVDYTMSIPQLVRETISCILSCDMYTVDVEYLQRIEYHSVTEFIKEAKLLHNKLLENLFRVASIDTVAAFVHHFQAQLAITTDLCVAAITEKKLGEKVIVGILHRNPQAPQLEDSQGKTPLMVATEYGSEVLMTVLIEHGADCDFPKGLLPLYKASELGFEETVQLLLDRHISCETIAEPLKESPLQIAIKKGHLGIIRQLLDRGRISNLDQALGVALKAKQEAIAQLLFDHGATAGASACDTAITEGDVALAGVLIDRAQIPPEYALVKACGKLQEAIVRLLLDNGTPATGRALEEACWGRSQPIVRLLLERGAPITEAALAWASYRGPEPNVRLLLARGASATELALSWARRGWSEAVMQLLLDRGAPVTEHTTQRALEGGEEAFVRLLLDRGLVATEDLLWNVGNIRHDAMIRLLFDRGVPATECTLRNACRRGKEDVVRHLLDRGVSATGGALCDASENGHDVVVRRLLGQTVCPGILNPVRVLFGYGVHLESHNVAGQTPLMLASKNGHKDVVRTLQYAGANCNSRDKNGRTPLGWAMHGRHESVVKFLRSKGATDEGVMIPGGGWLDG